MDIGTRVVITDMSHKHLLKNGELVYKSRHSNESVVELDTGEITIVKNSELALA